MTAARLLFKTQLIVAGHKELFITFQNAVFQYFGNNRTYSYTTKVFDGYRLRIHNEVMLFFNIGTVNDCPNSLGTHPTNNIRLNNLAKIHGKLILQYRKCSTDNPSRPAALTLSLIHI